MMMMTKSVMWGCWACVVVVVAGMVTVVSGGVAESKQQRPNIVLILADDLGIGDVGVYPNPQPKAKRLKTPNIDMLAEQGMTFTDAYTGYSVSAPSRWSLMTGYHTGHKEVSSEARLLGNSSITVAHVLREAGYATAAIGKWGLDGNPLLPHPIGDGFPTRQGFDMYYGQSSEIECYNYYPAWMYDSEHNVTIQANRNATPQACGHDYAQCSWSGDLWTQRAVDYITQQATSQHSQKDQRDGATPFFLYLSYTAPHAGDVGRVGERSVPAPRQSKGPFANKTAWPAVERGYATAVWDVDEAVGKVVAAIDDADLVHNTLVMFASANGAHNDAGHSYLFFNSSGFLNGFKGSIHDGGHRTAFVARWVGTISEGVTTRQQIAFYDMLPTLAELAGAKPGTLPPKMDGQSFVPTLVHSAINQPEFIYHEFAGCQDPICKQVSSLNCKFGQNIRMGNWSGVCVGPDAPCTGKAPGHFFLYDMSVDEGQHNNVAALHPNVVEQLLTTMRQQYDKNWPNK